MVVNTTHSERNFFVSRSYFTRTYILAMTVAKIFKTDVVFVEFRSLFATSGEQQTTDWGESIALRP